MGIGFVILLPFIFWIFIVMLIIAVSSQGRARRGVQSGQRTVSAQRYPSSATRKGAGRVTSTRPQMQKGLFDMNLDRERKKSEKSFSLSDFLGRTGFDKYEAKGRNKDFVKGYDRTINVKKAQHMQFSHTYDGHEPWDKCLPKEKDPWDKDFYA